MLKRVWNIGIWALLAAAVVLALVAWSPSLRLRFGSIRDAAERGGPNDFTLPTLDGRSFSLAEHRGQVVLVNFWATWCPPCRVETPDLVALQSDYASRGFQIVGVNMDEDRGNVGPFVRQYRLNYPVVLPNGSFPLANGVDALPTSILIDRNGRVARRYVGMISEAAIRADIDKLLAERKSH
jgi:thiol-disulfide isomerase/thioredoxin